MKFMLALLGLSGLGLVVAQQDATPPQVLDPVGSYLVATADEGGTPLRGTLTIEAGEAGEYTGRFLGPDGEIVPVHQVTTNRRHLMAIIETGAGMAVTWLQRQPDGNLTGTWHLLGDGIRVTATRRGATVPAGR
jgi:hypothetical protein